MILSNSVFIACYGDFVEVFPTFEREFPFERDDDNYSQLRQLQGYMHTCAVMTWEQLLARPLAYEAIPRSLCVYAAPKFASTDGN